MNTLARSMVVAACLLALAGSGACATGSGGSGGTSVPAGPTGLETGPAVAEVGVAYPFDLNIHCGGEFVRFASAWWRTSTPPGPGQPDPSATITSSRELDFRRGLMTRTGDDTAEFQPTDSTQTIAYTLIDETPPLCA